MCGLEFRPGNIPGTTTAAWSVLNSTNTSATTFTNALLIGKTIKMVFLDSAHISSIDYSFTTGSGTIVWGFAATVGVPIQIAYA